MVVEDIIPLKKQGVKYQILQKAELMSVVRKQETR